MSYKVSLNPVIFRKLFEEREDEEYLLSFLNSILADSSSEELNSIAVFNSDNMPTNTSVDNVESITTIAYTNSRSAMFIEINFYSAKNVYAFNLLQHSSFCSNILACSQSSVNISKGLVINILDSSEFSFLPLDKFHSVFRFCANDLDYFLTDSIEIHCIDTHKYDTFADKNLSENCLHRWLSFFSPETSESTLNELFKIDSLMGDLSIKLSRLLADKETRFLGLLYDNDLLSEYSNRLAKAKEEGKLEGIKMIEKENSSPTLEDECLWEDLDI